MVTVCRPRYDLRANVNFSIAARAASSWPDAASGETRTSMAIGGGREHVAAGTGSAEARRIKEAHRRLEQRYAVHRVLRSTSNLSSGRRTVEATEAATWTLEALLSRVGPLNMNKLKQRGTDLNLNTYGMYGVGGAGKRA